MIGLIFSITCVVAIPLEYGVHAAALSIGYTMFNKKISMIIYNFTIICLLKIIFETNEIELYSLFGIIICAILPGKEMKDTHIRRKRVNYFIYPLHLFLMITVKKLALLLV